MSAHKVVLAIFAALLLCCSLSAGPETPRRIEISASKFSYSPNEITLKKGEPVVLVLRSTDVTHGLTIPDLGIETTEIKKGKDSEISLTPDKTGHFSGQCAHFCGAGHGSMIFQVEVTE
jgi:cytochrome c oxidase subunit II